MNRAAKELISRSHFGSPAFTLDGCNTELQALAASMCSNPIKVIGKDRYEDIQRTYYVSCGKCFNCRNLKGNELSSRFYHDASILKHAYFITLTYPSYESIESIPAVLRPCFWHFDAYNSSGRFCYSPCLLYYPHIQAYIKLLRTRLTRHFGEVPYLEFITTGELGHRFGRPHWHLLIISNKVLTKELISLPWFDTIKNYNTRIDFVDIVQNGTLEARQDISSSPSVKRNAKHCVKYLVKYTQKTDLKHINTTRLSWALPYFQMVPFDDEFTPLLGTDIVFTPTQFHYEKLQTLFKIPRGKSQSSFQSFSELSLRDLYAFFGTKHQCSTTNAIGKLYALQNVERFASGNKKVKPIPMFTPTMVGNDRNDVPHLSQKTLNVFPAYYSRLTQRYQFPIVICSKTSKGAIQYNSITMSRLRASYTLLLRFANNVNLCRSASEAESYYMSPTSSSDIDFFGIQPSESELSLFFPSKIVKNKTYLYKENNHWLVSYFYDTSTKTRYAPFTLFDLVDDFVVPVGICFCRQQYVNRRWTSPEVVDVESILTCVYDSLIKYKRSYMQSKCDMELFVSMMDSVLPTEEYSNARDVNDANWKTFKSKINKQTKNLNSYD